MAKQFKKEEHEKNFGKNLGSEKEHSKKEARYGQEGDYKKEGREEREENKKNTSDRESFYEREKNNKY
jgi:hypothetical protein